LGRPTCGGATGPWPASYATPPYRRPGRSPTRRGLVTSCLPALLRTQG